MLLKRKPKSIFRIILSALLLTLTAEVLLIIGSLFASGVTDQLDENAQDILRKQVENRSGYLHNEMVENWNNLSYLANTINKKTQQLINSGEISLEELDGSSDACSSLLMEITDDLISTLYSKQTNGIFVIFNTHSLQEESGEIYKPGIYIRDMDPISTPPMRNSDLLLERAPMQVAQALGISTDSAWQPLFHLEKGNQEGLLYTPFQTALEDHASQPVSEYGYWTKSTYTMHNDTLPAISYSIPLILEDNTIYGVLGIELLETYLQSMMPYDELYSYRQGSYLMGTLTEQEETGNASLYVTLLSSGPSLSQSLVGQELPLIQSGDGYSLTMEGNTFYLEAQPLSLYSRNGFYSSDQWVIAGTVRTDFLFSVSTRLKMLMVTTTLITVTISVMCSLIASRRFTHPITQLSREVQAHQGKAELPDFSHTYIREIDQFASAITNLSQEVLETSTTFLRIIDMASVDLGGYELKKDSDKVFFTDNFFPLLGKEPVSPDSMTADSFRKVLEDLDLEFQHTLETDGSKLYRIPLPDGQIRYLRMEEASEDNCQVGLAEDVTAATLERMRIEYERDYDSLTGLRNRRAFQRRIDLLFQNPEHLGHAALLMMDLDNLKGINDTYGHDWGDQYIRQAGQCLAENTPSNTLCARVSGDEFFLLFYGYPDKESIRPLLEKLTDAVKHCTLRLPSGKELTISASGGVAWYPDDTQDLRTMMKFADFAMYQVKRSQKGELGDFDIGSYNQATYHMQSKQDFQKLLANNLLAYHFQPIVSARTGRPVAYEALMRVDLPTLHTPDAVLRMAREENCLHEIERMTLFNASEAFQGLIAQNAVEKDALLFVNSIANQHLSEQEAAEFVSRFSDIQKQLVVEITEADTLDAKAMQSKRNFPGFSGMLALDDYGSGYNTEKNLLELSPRFIKIDISIIQDIHKDTDKQQILSNIISYAHQRDMYIIAEGLENASEVIKVLELGVDLLQGFFLARPAALPGTVSPDAIKLIKYMNSTFQKKNAKRQKSE